VKVYEMVGDGLLELDPSEWSEMGSFEIAVEGIEAETVVLAEEQVPAIR
jgi:hypothetical protein